MTTGAVQDAGGLAGAVHRLDEAVQEIDEIRHKPAFEPGREQDRRDMASALEELEAAARLVVARWSND